jgi:hypothetical protein
MEHIKINTLPKKVISNNFSNTAHSIKDEKALLSTARHGHYVQASTSEAMRYLKLVDENTHKNPEIALLLGDA